MIKLYERDEEYFVLRIICSFAFVRICLFVNTTCLIDNTAKKAIVVLSVPDVCLFFSSQEFRLHFRQSNGLSAVIKVRFMLTSASSVHLGPISHICPFSETHISNQILFKVQFFFFKKTKCRKDFNCVCTTLFFCHLNDLRAQTPTYAVIRLCFLPMVMICR